MKNKIFLGGILSTTQFRSTAIAQPILDYLKKAQTKNFSLSPDAKRTLRLIAALVAVRTAHKPELREQAQNIFNAYGQKTLSQEESLRLRCYYPIDKLNRYRDDLKEMARILK